jgi:hypothetical protein
MQPALSINHLAILTCVVAAMPVGFLWFGPVFGKPWARAMGFDPEERAGGMGKAMALYALGNFLIAFVLAHSAEVWRPSVWKAGEEDAPAYVYALSSALWTWVGFFLPLQIGRVAWEKKGWSLVAINAGFDLTRLLMFAFILAYWRG